MLYLALHSGASYVSTRQIGEMLGESPHFVAKILHQLASAGLVRSYRGPNGGIALARKPEKTSIKDIIDVMDGKRALEKCVLGNKECSSESPCAMHEDWAPIRSQILDLVKERTLAQVAGQIRMDRDSRVKSGRPPADYLRQMTL